MTIDTKTMTLDDLQDALEAIVDRFGLTRTLMKLSAIAFMKAEHLRVNWQDRQAAVTWELDAKRIDKLVERISN